MRSIPIKRSVPPIRVRAATCGDLDALLALEQQVFVSDRLSRRSLRRLLQSPTAAVVVAEAAGGALAGMAILLFRRHSTTARLYSIAVVPPMSGKGIGARLLEEAERVALGCGCTAIRLEVHEANHGAMSRYRKSGYREFGRHSGYYQDGGDALRFEKRLSRERAGGDIAVTRKRLIV